MKRIRFDWTKLLSKNKYWGAKYSHARENARRIRQMAQGILTVSNGVVR